VSIEIANESGAELDEAALAALARHVLDSLRIHPLAELSVLLVDETAMSELHVRWMGESGPTDVLAFPMDELRPPQPGGARTEHGQASDPGGIPGLLGDVVICPQVAGRQASEAGHGGQDEIELLCTHGILHLLGYDHADPQEQATMFGLQGRLLAAWRSERDEVLGRPGESAAARSGGDAAAGSAAAQAAEAAEAGQDAARPAAARSGEDEAADPAVTDAAAEDAPAESAAAEAGEDAAPRQEGPG
jgi:probable rRNA maturation factor